MHSTGCSINVRFDLRRSGTCSYYLDLQFTKIVENNKWLHESIESWLCSSVTRLSLGSRFRIYRSWFTIWRSIKDKTHNAATQFHDLTLSWYWLVISFGNKRSRSYKKLLCCIDVLFLFSNNTSSSTPDMFGAQVGTEQLILLCIVISFGCVDLCMVTRTAHNPSPK